MTAANPPIRCPLPSGQTYEPHEYQRTFHRESERFAALTAGVRGGKTKAASYEFYKRICLDMRSKPRGDDGWLRYWLVAPTYAIGRVQFREFTTMLGGIGSRYIKEWRATDRELILPGRVSVAVKSTDNKTSLVAEGLDGYWLDEAARADEESYLGGLRMRVADRLGWSLFSTTPLGRNWFWSYIIKPAWEGVVGYSVHSWRTVDNTAMPSLMAEVEAARLTLPETYFRREFEASFDAFVGQVYAEFQPTLHVVRSAPASTVETRYGIDWGFRNPGVITVNKKDGDGAWWTVQEERASGLDIGDARVPTGDSWVNRARKIAQTHGAQNVFFCDPSRPDNIAALRKAGLRVQPANNDVLDGIQTISKAIHPVGGRPGYFVLMCCPELIREFLAYRWKDTTAKEEPVKEDDHGPDSIRYALHTKPHKAMSW